jgi:hypothetical protein
LVVAFVLLAVTTFSVSLWYGIERFQILTTLRIAEGHVIAEQRQVKPAPPLQLSGFRNSNRMTVEYAPVVQFTTAEGTNITVTGRVRSSFLFARVGETVPVRYDPDDPGAAVIATFAELWGPVLAWGGFGILWSVSALGAGMLMRRRVRAPGVARRIAVR